MISPSYLLTNPVLELISEVVKYYHDITVIFGTQFLQYVIVLSFKVVHNYQGMLL